MEEGRTYKALFTRAVATVQRGTESEIKNFIRHAENGCYDDPFTAIDMVVDSRAYLPNKGHGLMPLFRLRGTNMTESTNWPIKSLVLDSTRLSAAVVHMRLDIRGTQFNLFKDNSLQHIIGKDPEHLTSTGKRRSQPKGGVYWLRNRSMKQASHLKLISICTMSRSASSLSTPTGARSRRNWIRYCHRKVDQIL
jgi:hypothetical protein